VIHFINMIRPVVYKFGRTFEIQGAGRSALVASIAELRGASLCEMLATKLAPSHI
jgi:hypothetical protein